MTSQPPLANVSVLDLTQFVAGPYCSMLLADLGARVVKIERPVQGEPYRRAGPFFINEQSSLFVSLNRNKLSLTLDLKKEKGKKIFLKLVEKFEVLIENFTPGTMENLGLGYDKLREINPRLIYCSISGFGQTGPYRSKKGFDLTVQGMVGLMDLTGESGGPPVKVGVPLADFAAAMYAAVGILTAYIQRERTGLGQRVDTSLYESCLGLLSSVVGNYFIGGEIPRRMGSASPQFAPYQAFKTKDDFITLAGTGSEEIWRRFCQAIGRPSMADDPRFKDNAERAKNQKVLGEELERILSKRGAKEWIGILDAAGVPCGPVRNLAEVLNDEHTYATDMVVELKEPGTGLVKTIGLPVKLSSYREIMKNPWPGLGGHTDEILSSLGFSPEQIKSLRAEAVV